VTVSDAIPITALLDGATVQEIADQAWTALVGEEEFLVPLPAPLPADTLSSGVRGTARWSSPVAATPPAS
jgi:chemotaxis protein CheX